ncbi:MAG: hypothetical protein LBS44_01640 [Deltaproteobacteria bacterium]|jgi:hypothetical protein|nr:hypothetical protein [Deltaproteobacteria bacterium]
MSPAQKNLRESKPSKRSYASKHLSTEEQQDSYSEDQLQIYDNLEEVEEQPEFHVVLLEEYRSQITKLAEASSLGQIYGLGDDDSDNEDDLDEDEDDDSEDEDDLDDDEDDSDDEDDLDDDEEEEDDDSDDENDLDDEDEDDLDDEDDDSEDEEEDDEDEEEED